MARNLLLTAAFGLLLIGSAAAQPGKKSRQSVKEITANLATPIDLKDFNQPMTLKEGLALLHEKLTAKKKGVVFAVDQDGFKGENPDAPDIFETRVQLKAAKKPLPAGKLLAQMLAEVPTKNATFVVREGYVDITTLRRAKDK